MSVLFAKAVVARLDEEIEKVRIGLGDGKAADWADYRRMVGEIKAFKRARDEVESLLRATDEDVEDDELEKAKRGGTK